MSIGKIINGVAQVGSGGGDITVTSSTLVSPSAIVMKPSGDTDDYFTFATASNIPTIYGTGAYVRIGDAGTTGHSLASEDDLLVSGNLEVDGIIFFDGDSTFYSKVTLTDLVKLWFGTDNTESMMRWSTYDANANSFQLLLTAGGATDVPVVVIGDYTNFSTTDIGLFDGVTQPLMTIHEKSGKLHTMNNGVADAGAASAILKHTGGFTNSVVGDIVRITAGTLCTTGWYWITTVTSADQVTLDRNYTSGNTTDVTCAVYHNFPMIGADGVCLKCFDGTPTDSNTEIDRDGWLQLDANANQLVHRSQATWRYIQNAKRTVEAVTTTNAITEAESGSVFTNLGDGDGSTQTLPADAAAGTNFTFTLLAAQELRIIVGKAASKFYLGGVISTDDGGNDLYVSADDEGESITLCCDGANGWFPLAINGTWTVTQP